MAQTAIGCNAARNRKRPREEEETVATNAERLARCTNELDAARARRLGLVAPRVTLGPRIMREENGRPSATLATHGDTLRDHETKKPRRNIAETSAAVALPETEI